MGSRQGFEPGRRSGGTEDQLDRTISLVLRLGLIASATLVAIGAVIYLARHGTEIVSYHTFRGEPAKYRRLGSILGEAAHFRGRGFVLTGLLLLLATPLLRVAFSVLAFLRRRDWRFVFVTLTVLGLLLFSLILGGWR
jgi:uncharacterized membrane protein